jgi:hypothetical protein
MREQLLVAADGVEEGVRIDRWKANGRMSGAAWLRSVASALRA